MTTEPDSAIHRLPSLDDRIHIFRDREDAGNCLAGMLNEFFGSGALVLAIPAGGVPVASAIHKRLNIAIDLAVASKITLPWNTEAGYGAVAFDGTVLLNDELVAGLGLSEKEIAHGIALTRDKVDGRLRRSRGDRPFPNLAGRPVILVDDGLASGLTMRVAVGAVRVAGAGRLIVAIPTAHNRALASLRDSVEDIYCANVRTGHQFAVAEAYQTWSDIDEVTLDNLIRDVLP